MHSTIQLQRPEFQDAPTGLVVPIYHTPTELQWSEPVDDVVTN